MKPTKGDFNDLLGVGGVPCLDFVNTVSGRGTADAFDRLEGYGDLADWARAVGLISDREAKQLKGAAQRHPGQARDCFKRAVALRELLYRLGLGALRGTMARRDLAELPGLLLPVMTASGFEAEASGRLRLTPQDRPLRLDRPLWFVAWSAFRLLTGEEPGQLRQCENSGCTWLFLDRSKNHSRRWCSMTQCGAVVKAREYRARRRAGR